MESTSAPATTVLPRIQASGRSLAPLLFDTREPDLEPGDSRLTVFHFNRFLLCRGHLRTATHCRDRARLNWCDLDHYLLHLPLEHGLVAGDRTRVRPGDLVLLDLAQAAVFRLTCGECVSLLIPRTALALHDDAQLHGLVLRQRSAAGGLLGSLLLALSSAAPDLSADEAMRLSPPVLGMIGACLMQQARSRQVRFASGPSELARRVRLYIEHNLHRDDLTPHLLAKALGTSRSQLYRAFEPFGGVRHYLLQRRLRRCLLALGDAANAGRRIGDLAYAHGFADETHFSRAFRKAYGMAPGAVRKGLQRGELPALTGHAGEHALLAHWIAELTCH